MTTPLTPEERQRFNAQLAEACGYTNVDRDYRCGDTLMSSQGWTPDYCSSLDACALAGAVLSEEERDEYFRVLEELVDSELGYIRSFAVGDATALQRSRALATIFARRAQQ